MSIRGRSLDGGKTLKIDIADDAKERRDFDEIIDLLRRNILYQTPVGIWEKKRLEEDPERDPDFVGVRFVPAHFLRLCEVVAAYGGWTPPIPEEEHEKKEGQ